MATYEIKAASLYPISLIPDTELAEILQNVQTIISTMKGTIPLDREFGIDSRVIDLPMHVAQAKLSHEIFQAIKHYEPRVTIEDISFTATLEGRLVPKVKVSG